MDPAVSWIADTLDYEPLPLPSRVVKPARTQQKRLWITKGMLKLVSTVVMAVGVGATAAAMHAAIDALVGWRNDTLARYYTRSLLQAYGVELGISCGLVAVSAIAVQLLAPRAAGGGVTWCMAYLNGSNLPGIFSPLVFLVKWAGSVASMGASMCLGVEAPAVHLGCCLASMAADVEQKAWAMLCRWRNRSLEAGEAAADSTAAAVGNGNNNEGGGSSAQAQAERRSSWLAAVDGHASSNADRREMISAGAAAGIAAAFGAPIGGVLFSLEEACSVWSHRIAWHCFVACAVAVFTHTQLNPRSEGGMLATTLHPLSPVQWLQQLPAVVGVGIAGGLLGAAFHKLRLAVRPLRAKPKHHVARIREAVAVAALTVSTIAVLAASVGRCLPVPGHWTGGEWVQHTCPPGHYNDLATLWLSPSVWSIRSLLSMGTAVEPMKLADQPFYYSPATLATVTVAYVFLFGLSAALAIPGGLFMPALLLGGSCGALYGTALRMLLPAWHIQPGLYALCCATAVLGAVFRSSISLAVLMMEATGSLVPMFGVIISVMASNGVSLLMRTEGVYESELEAEPRVNYLTQEPPSKLRGLAAEHLMASPAVGLPRVVPVSVADNLMRYCRHNGFPVYDPLHRDTQSGLFRLDGFIMRSQVELLLSQRAYCDRHGRYLTLQPAEADAFEQQLAAAMTSHLQRCPSGGTLVGQGGEGGSGDLSIGGLSGRAAVLAQRPSPFDQAVVPHINLGPFLNLAPMAVRLDTPAPRVHAMFTSLSLRHVVVVNESNQVCGMITRRDLAHAAGSRLLSIRRSMHEEEEVLLDSSMERPMESE